VITIRVGDVREQLRQLDAKSVQCVVTSPPYFNLRDYGTAKWHGGDTDCQHKGRDVLVKSGGPGKQYTNVGSNAVFGGDCPCGAVREDKQIGMEATPAEFVATLVDVFREVRRVLRDDGVLFVNLADSRAGSGKGPQGNGLKASYWTKPETVKLAGAKTSDGIRAKSLMLIPARFAIAMSDDGWIVRDQIVWAKKAPMPESVRDRCTSSWEPIWMFTKQARYFWDAAAVAQPSVSDHPSGNGYKRPEQLSRGGRGQDEPWQVQATSNMRNVWHLSPEPSREAHYASFPTEIPRRCILAATSQAGQCAKCGSPWARVVERERGTPGEVRGYQAGVSSTTASVRHGKGSPNAVVRANSMQMTARGGVKSENLGWQPSCICEDAGPPVPQTVLDPFVGSGTTLLVADRLERNGIGIDLNAEYAEIARRRCANDAPMFADVTAAG